MGGMAARYRQAFDAVATMRGQLRCCQQREASASRHAMLVAMAIAATCLAIQCSTAVTHKVGDGQVPGGVICETRRITEAAGGGGAAVAGTPRGTGSRDRLRQRCAGGGDGTGRRFRAATASGNTARLVRDRRMNNQSLRHWQGW